MYVERIGDRKVRLEIVRVREPGPLGHFDVHGPSRVSELMAACKACRVGKEWRKYEQDQSTGAK